MLGIGRDVTGGDSGEGRDLGAGREVGGGRDLGAGKDLGDGSVRDLTAMYESEIPRRAPIITTPIFILVSVFTRAFLLKAHEDAAQ
jgi:hypothetical protein